MLSVGNNLISQLDNVMYLRPFTRLQVYVAYGGCTATERTKLIPACFFAEAVPSSRAQNVCADQAVNLVGNPFCQEDEYRRYVLAHLKFIKYLDYRLVDQQATAQAKEQYQDELLDLEESENQQEDQASQAEEKAKRVAVHHSANMKGMDELMDELMVKGDGDMAKLRGQQQFQEPLLQLAEQVNSCTDEHIGTVMVHKEAKDKEKDDFDTAIEYAKAEAAAESKAEIAAYNALAKRSLVEGTGESYAVLQTLHKANDALYEKLMDLEISSSERYADSIHAFDSAYEELTKKTLEVISGFFAKLRDFEAAYHERLVAAGSELLEKVAADQAEYMAEEARTMLQDKDTLMGVINAAHDARVARLDAKEDELRTLEDGACKAIVKGAVDAEYNRNRTRVIEIWNICHVVNKNELASDRFDE